jgi:hypothetical protein
MELLSTPFRLVSKEVVERGRARCPTYGISLSPLWERVRERGNKKDITLPLSLPSREGEFVGVCQRWINTVLHLRRRGSQPRKRSFSEFLLRFFVGTGLVERSEIPIEAAVPVRT